MSLAVADNLLTIGMYFFINSIFSRYSGESFIFAITRLQVCLFDKNTRAVLDRLQITSPIFFVCEQVHVPEDRAWLVEGENVVFLQGTALAQFFLFFGLHFLLQSQLPLDNFKFLDFSEFGGSIALGNSFYQNEHGWLALFVPSDERPFRETLGFH